MSESWEPLFEWWHKTAYRGTPEPTKLQKSARMREFLKMVKKCDCGKWHLEIGQKCKGCKKRNEN